MIIRDVHWNFPSVKNRHNIDFLKNYFSIFSTPVKTILLNKYFLFVTFLRQKSAKYFTVYITAMIPRNDIWKFKIKWKNFQLQWMSMIMIYAACEQIMTLCTNQRSTPSLDNKHFKNPKITTCVQIMTMCTNQKLILLLLKMDTKSIITQKGFFPNSI